MSTKTVEVLLTGNAASLVRSLDEGAAASDDAAAKMSGTFDKASSDVGNIFTRVGTTLGNWGVPFSGSLSKMGKDLDDAKSHGKGFEQGLQDVGGIATGVAVVGLIAVGAESIRMADSFDQAHNQLRQAVDNTGGSFTKMQGQVAATDTKMRALGFTDTETEESMAKLVDTSGNAGAGLQYAGLAANIAAGTHRSLTSVDQALGMALDGNVSRLQRMGISLNVTSATTRTLQADQLNLRNAQENLLDTQQKVNDGQLTGVAAAQALGSAHQRVTDAENKLSTAQGAVRDAIDQVSQRFRGDAAAAADTLHGKMQILGADAEHVGVSLGNALIPMVEEAGQDLSNLVGFFERNHDAAYALAAVVGGPLVVAMGAFAVNKVAKTADDIAKAWNNLTTLGSKVMGIFQSETGAVDTNTTQVGLNSGAEGENATQTELMGAAHAEVVPELEASGAAAGEGQLAFEGMGAEAAGTEAGLGIAGGGLLAVAGAAAVVVGPLAAVAYGAHQLIGGMNPNPVIDAANALHAFNAAQNPALMLSTAKALDKETDSGNKYVEVVLRSTNYQRAKIAADQAEQQSADAVTMAQGQAADAIGNFNDAVQQSGPFSLQAAAAEAQVHDQIDNVKDVAGQAYDAEIKLSGGHETAAGQAKAQISALQQLAAQYPQQDSYIDTMISHLQTLAAQHPKPTADLVDNATPKLTPIINQLNSLAGKVVTVTVNAVGSAVAAGFGKPAAEGDIVTSPQLRLVGEDGPEVIGPLDDPVRLAELLQQGGALNKMTSFSAGTGLGGTGAPGAVGPAGPSGPVSITQNSYQLTVTAPVGSDPAAIGRECVVAIEAYEGVAGTSWRS